MLDGIDGFGFNVRAFVQDPHGLGGVHHRTPTQGDNPLGGKFAQASCPAANCFQGRVWLDLVDNQDFHPGGGQSLADALYHTQTYQGSIGDDGGARAAQALKVAEGLLAKDNLRAGKKPHGKLQEGVSQSGNQMVSKKNKSERGRYVHG